MSRRNLAAPRDNDGSAGFRSRSVRGDGGQPEREIAVTTAELNAGEPVHNWYQIPESYSSTLVREYASQFGIKPGDTILDPFGGAGTTAVCAQLAGMDAVSVEVNPFLSFAARVKTHRSYDVSKLRRGLRRVLDEVARGEGSPGEPPSMPRLEKWISPRVISKVLWLKRAIMRVQDPSQRNLFQLALAAILRPVGNLKLTAHAFGSVVLKEDAPVCQLFELKVRQIITDVETIEWSACRAGDVAVITGDAREVSTYVQRLFPAHLAITSPPYLNNLDYTMQTRLELFFLDFVRDLKELRDLRKRMMICDAKAVYREIRDLEFVSRFESINSVAAAIGKRHQGKTWGWDYPFMVRQYFGGLYRVLDAVKKNLFSGSRFVIVVGESAHSGVKVPVPDILAEIAESLGYVAEELIVHRERRCSSHDFRLKEASVVLRKP